MRGGAKPESGICVGTRNENGAANPATKRRPGNRAQSPRAGRGMGGDARADSRKPVFVDARNQIRRATGQLHAHDGIFRAGAGGDALREIKRGGRAGESNWLWPDERPRKP